jgi:hypothetical protein
MDKKSAQFCFRFIFNPTHHSLPFHLDFLPVRTDYVGKHCGGKLGWSDLSIPCQKLHVRYYNTLTKPVVRAKQRSKNHKKSFRQSWCQQEALIMRPLAVAAMAVAVRADRPDCWPEGRHLEARRRRITTVP